MRKREIILAVLCLAVSMLLSGCGDGTTDSNPVAPSESATSSADIEPSETASAPVSEAPRESPSEEPSEPVSGQPSDSPSEELSASDAPAGDETGDTAGGETTTPEEVVLDLGEYGTVTLSGGLASDKAEFVFAEGDDYGGEPRDWFYFDVAAGSTCTITPSDVCKYTIIDLMAYTLEDGKYVASFLVNDEGEKPPRHRLYADGQIADRAYGALDLNELPLATSEHPAYFTFGENSNILYERNPEPIVLKADGTLYRLTIHFFDESQKYVDGFIFPFFVK